MTDACDVCTAVDECECRRCVVCTRTRLSDDLPQTCRGCIARVLTQLADVLALAVHLPGEAAEHANAPLPGGNPMVMMAGGSVGRGDALLGDPAVDADPPSLAYELGGWEDVWRRAHGEPAALHTMSVVSAGAYLAARVPWAAQWFDGFEDFARDVRTWRAVLVGTLRAGIQPDRYVTCMTCGGARLEREFLPPARCRHKLPVPWRASQTLDEYRAERDAVAAEHAQCDQGGRRDVWSCPKCGDEYDSQRYWLAVRQVLDVPV